MRTLITLFLLLLPLSAAAKNPLKPGDDVVPFRSYTNDGRLQNTPPKGSEGTCWRVLAVTRNTVTVALVSGIYKPHWEGKSFDSFIDEYDYRGDGGNPDFPIDLKKRHFSIFKPTEVCPIKDVPDFEIKPGAYFIEHQDYDAKTDIFIPGAVEGEEAGCFQIVSVSDQGAMVKHVSGPIKYWWNDGAVTEPGETDIWFTQEDYKENHPKADNLEMLRQIMRAVPYCP